MSEMGLGRVKTALGMSVLAGMTPGVCVSQAAIAVINGLTPAMFMTRVRL